MQFEVPGKPQPKQRPRRNSKTGVWYTPSATRKYESLVAQCALAAGVRPFRGPVEMEVEIYWPDKRRRDLDNTIKSISDALNGIAYQDDSQISRLVTTKHLDRDNPRAVITITPTEEKQS